MKRIIYAFLVIFLFHNVAEAVMTAVKQGTSDVVPVQADDGGNLLCNILSLESNKDSVQAETQQVSTASEGPVSCTSSGGVLIANNSARVKFMIRNQSIVKTYICYAATCSTSGMWLLEGESWDEMNYTGTVSCITDSATVTITTKEL